MKKKHWQQFFLQLFSSACFMITIWVFFCPILLIGQNVGVGINTPEGKLHVKANNSETPLVADMGVVIGNQPLLRIRTSQGFDILQMRAGFGNVFIGMDVGQNNNFNFPVGINNTAIGHGSFKSNQGGIYNTALGYFSLSSNINGTYNTAIGVDAMKTSTNTTLNTAVGDGALFTLSTGNNNTAVGASALYKNYSGNNNTSIGYQSSFNISVGADYNVAVGAGALFNNSTGVRNIALGAGTGVAANSQFGNTISIGNHNYLNAASNQAFLGNLNIVWTGGNVGWSTFSDARIKTDVEENVPGLPFIMLLRPVTYRRNTAQTIELTGNADDSVHFANKYQIDSITFTGFIAQEVEAAARKLGYNFSGIHRPASLHQLYSITYETFVVPLVKAVQEQQAQIERLNQIILSSNTRMNEIERELQTVKGNLKE